MAPAIGGANPARNRLYEGFPPVKSRETRHPAVAFVPDQGRTAKCPPVERNVSVKI